MASYVVLARKWRPQQFADIVGQGPIVRTMMNAIRTERLHQAYLLTGSRGIGKTSIARIFAKALRCPNARWVEEGRNQGTLVSCNECPSCREITAGSSVDVIEIDGASNNGVDAVREIRENVKYLPASGDRKIYIIDEVHMLTTQAWNALLKTLEEPPPHVIFIFATTEPHKIPATILSRCQRFDLRRVTAAQIQARLTEVTGAEGIQAEPGALALIARAADGSIRDSMSLLDQVISFAGQKVTAGDVRESIGLIQGQMLIGILSGVLGRRALDALALVDQAYQQGHDLRVLSRSLLEFLHALILKKVGAQNTASIELSEDEWREMDGLAGLRPLEELEMIFQVLHHGIDWIARSPQPKIVLDVLLVKCASAEALIFAADAGGDGGGGGAKAGAERATARPAPTRAPNPVRAEAATAPAPAMAIAPAANPAPVRPQPTTVAPTAASPAGVPPTRPATASLAAAVSPAPAAASVRHTDDASFEGLIAFVRQTRPLLASILEHGACLGIPTRPGASDGAKPAPADLVVGYRGEDAYFREQLQAKAYSEQLISLTREYFGRPVRIRIELSESGKEIKESLADRRERQREERENAIRAEAQNHPMIREAKALFGGELGPIELTGPTEGAIENAKHP